MTLKNTRAPTVAPGTLTNVPNTFAFVPWELSNEVRRSTTLHGNVCALPNKKYTALNLVYVDKVGRPFICDRRFLSNPPRGGHGCARDDEGAVPYFPIDRTPPERDLSNCLGLVDQLLSVLSTLK